MNYQTAFDKVIGHEGGYVNHPSDPGGETKYGISKNTYSDLDIKNLTKDEARQLYRNDYWDKYKIYSILDYFLAEKAIIAIVNIGPTNGIICLQRAVRAVTGRILKEDGVLGSKTSSSINVCDETSLIAAYKSELAGYYRSLNHPYEDGLLNRAYD